MQKLLLSSVVLTLLVGCGESDSNYPPVGFTLTSPTDAATDVSVLPTLEWTASARATSYTLTIDDSVDMLTPVAIITGLTTNSHTLTTQLAYNTTYYWRVIAYNGDGAAAATNNDFSFTTAIEAPAAFVLSTPNDTATNVSVLPTFDWDNSVRAASYTLVIDNDSDFSSPTETVTNLTSSTHTLSTPLAYNTQYYWRVTAINTTGSTTATNNDFSFTTIIAPPAAFNLLSPADAAVNVLPAPTFDWEDSVGSASYTLEVSDNALFTQPTLMTIPGLTSSTYSWSGALAYGTTYYWRVKAINISGEVVNSGAADTFETVTEGITITAPNGGEYLTASAQITVSWIATEGVSSNVIIEFSSDDGNTWSTLEASTPNDGTQDVTLPADISALCLIRVSDFADTQVLDVSDATFLMRNFTEVATVLMGTYRGCVAWGDHNNDGKLDIILGSGGNSIIYIGDGLGGFANLIMVSGGGGVAWGDYDRDGIIDLASAGGGHAKIYHNDGSGGFADSTITLTSMGTAALGWADYDNDGDFDLAISGATASNAQSVTLYNNDGAGSFADASISFTDVNQSTLEWADYDNDGDMDLAVGGYSTNNVTSIYENDGVGGLSLLTTLPGSTDGDICWGDFNSDGSLDIVVTGWGGTGFMTNLLFGNGAGGFTDANAGFTVVGNSSVACGDCDNDGDLDLVISGRNPNDSFADLTTLYINDGAGNFSELDMGLWDTAYSVAAWADYDNDGDLDLLLSGQSGTKLYRNDFPLTLANTPPTAPTGLNITLAGNVATLDWTEATDAKTPTASLSYNVRIGTATGANDIYSGNVSSTGMRLVPERGIVQPGSSTTQWMITLPASDTYYFSVQAVDTSFAGGAWSTEATVIVP